MSVKVVQETNHPEDEDKYEEKHRIDHSQEGLAEIYLPVTLILAPSLGLAYWSHLVVLSECVDVSLHYDIQERFEETEYQPAVDHLDVGGVGQISAHTNMYLLKKFNK